MRNSGMPPSQRGGGGGPPVKLRHPGRPMSEADSMLEEMKFKQQQRDKQKNLQRELQSNAMQGVRSQQDFMKVRDIQSQLAQVDSFLLRHDEASNAAGVQQLPSLNPSMLPINHPGVPNQMMGMGQLDPTKMRFGYDDTDNTTNLYVSNISGVVTEEMLASLFSTYGHIESVKILYPRSEDSIAIRKHNNLHAGFVQMTTRAQAEKARNALNGREIQGIALKVEFASGRSASWQAGMGSLPPAAAQQMAMQMGGGTAVSSTSAPGGPAMVPLQKPPASKIIEVELPANSRIRRLVDLTAEFVAQEGWELEKVIAAREKKNKRFRFIQTADIEEVDKQDPLHIYYRWRVFAFLQGDTKFRWRTAPVQLSSTGPVWKPPPCCNAPPMEEQSEIPGATHAAADPNGPTAGVLQRLANQVAGQNIVKQGHPIGLRSQASGLGGKPLTEEESFELDDHLYYMRNGKKRIGDVMRFAIDYAASSKIIAEKMAGSILHASRPSIKHLKGKFFCVFDVLANSHVSKPGVSLYRRQFQEMLPDILEKIRKTQDENPANAAEMKTSVSRALEIWTEASLFPPLFVKGLESTLNFHAQKLADPPDNPLVQSKLQHWTAMSDPLQLERSCRLRGLQPLGTRNELVDRLCFFEMYWYEKGVEAAELAAAERAAAGELEAQKSRIEFDPELDGEALDDDDLKAVAEVGMKEGSDDEGEQSQKLKQALASNRKDRRKSEKLKEEARLQKAKEEAEAREKADKETEASKPGREGGSVAPSVGPKDELDDVFGDGGEGSAIKIDDDEQKEDKKEEEAQPDPDDEFEKKRKEEERKAEIRKARLRQVEVKVMQYQVQLEKDRLRPDQMGMACDRKRMELLEEIAQQESLEEMALKEKEKDAKRKKAEERLKADQAAMAAKAASEKKKKTEEEFSLFSPESEAENPEPPVSKPRKAADKEPKKDKEEEEEEKDTGTASPEWQSKVVKKAGRIRKGVDVSDRNVTTVGSSALLRQKEKEKEKVKTKEEKEKRNPNTTIGRKDQEEKESLDPKEEEKDLKVTGKELSYSQKEKGKEKEMKAIGI
eukprot:gnl/MRDRNA2_/MRDRNA2_95128_c0_seq1.p1 gnl/MRDRNA2_/MRDRNA2_95128_c0~~gnl/MRDRNA2_/MRDRNA2_95128_c0_seq1.p1  ORF type:complete len:1063 (+),score=328.62 gnl/MRDRNA2_/MRDRNA2_95128_c0_seq1:105-3293(+)